MNPNSKRWIDALGPKGWAPRMMDEDGNTVLHINEEGEVTTDSLRRGGPKEKEEHIEPFGYPDFTDAPTRGGAVGILRALFKEPTLHVSLLYGHWGIQRYSPRSDSWLGANGVWQYASTAFVLPAEEEILAWAAETWKKLQEQP